MSHSPAEDSSFLLAPGNHSRQSSHDGSHSPATSGLAGHGMVHSSSFNELSLGVPQKDENSPVLRGAHGSSGSSSANASPNFPSLTSNVLTIPAMDATRSRSSSTASDAPLISSDNSDVAPMMPIIAAAAAPQVRHTTIHPSPLSSSSSSVDTTSSAPSHARKASMGVPASSSLLFQLPPVPPSMAITSTNKTAIVNGSNNHNTNNGGARRSSVTKHSLDNHRSVGLPARGNLARIKAMLQQSAEESAKVTTSVTSGNYQYTGQGRVDDTVNVFESLTEAVDIPVAPPLHDGPYVTSAIVVPDVFKVTVSAPEPVFPSSSTSLFVPGTIEDPYVAPVQATSSTSPASSSSSSVAYIPSSTPRNQDGVTTMTFPPVVVASNTPVVIGAIPSSASSESVTIPQVIELPQQPVANNTAVVITTTPVEVIAPTPVVVTRLSIDSNANNKPASRKNSGASPSAVAAVEVAVVAASQVIAAPQQQPSQPAQPHQRNASTEILAAAAANNQVVPLRSIRSASRGGSMDAKIDLNLVPGTRSRGTSLETPSSTLSSSSAASISSAISPSTAASSPASYLALPSAPTTPTTPVTPLTSDTTSLLGNGFRASIGSKKESDILSDASLTPAPATRGVSSSVHARHASSVSLPQEPATPTAVVISSPAVEPPTLVIPVPAAPVTPTTPTTTTTTTNASASHQRTETRVIIDDPYQHNHHIPMQSFTDPFSSTFIPSAASIAMSPVAGTPELTAKQKMIRPDDPSQSSKAKKKSRMSSIWEQQGLVDWKFHMFNMDDFAEKSWLKRIRWLIAVGMAMNYLWGLVANVLVIRTMARAEQTNYTIAYSVAWALELIVFYIDSKAAYKVIKLDDVSDCYQNLEATRWLTIRSFAHYCFITKVSKTFTKPNKLVFWFYKTLRDWKRLVVTVVQVLLAIVYWADSMHIIAYNSDVDSSTGGHTVDTDKLRNDIDQNVTLKDFSIVFKLITASLSCVTFVLAFVCYPCFRIGVVAEVKSVHLTAKMYCSLKFEERLNEVMVEHYKAKGLPLPSPDARFMTNYDDMAALGSGSGGYSMMSSPGGDSGTP